MDGDPMWSSWTDTSLDWYAGPVETDDLARVHELVGQRCWSAAAGSGQEWLVVLDLGERLRRQLRLANRSLSFQQRTYEGSHAVIVEGAWRLERENEVVVTCLDARSPTDRIQVGLKELEGRSVMAVEVQAPAHDLVLRFDQGVTLRVFVLEPLAASAVSVPEGERSLPTLPPRSPASCWRVYTPNGTLQVGPHGCLVVPEGPELPPEPNGPKLSVIDGEGSS
ncbi:MAG: hypothetical protein KTR25_17005 [Myxococcales bacterium]|nr:hypothetical protein [Myxococcales bacterium]